MNHSLPLLLILALGLSRPALAGGAAGAPDHDGASAGLAPLVEDRYVVVDEIETSLDGVHRHRIPTLRAAHHRVPGPRMVVALYQQGEFGEVPLASEEGEDVRVERIVRLGRDGRRHLVVRVGNGSTCRGSSWLGVFGVRGGKAVRIVPRQTVHELEDVDGDGTIEALQLSTRLEGFAGLPPKVSPWLAKVWAYRRGKLEVADHDYLRYHWQRLLQLRRTLDRPVVVAPSVEQVGLAVSTFLEYEVLGQPSDGLECAAHYLRWVLTEGDPASRRAAERALAALEARVGRKAPGSVRSSWTALSRQGPGSPSRIAVPGTGQHR